MPPLVSFLLMVVSGWVHRHQLAVIEFLQAENRLLKDRLRGRRIRFTALRGSAGHSTSTTAKLRNELFKVLDNTAVQTGHQARLDELSAEPMIDTPERFAAFCRAEAEHYASIIKAAGISSSNRAGW